jgi:ATP-dependent Clp protease ATP-binding subunit ClpA
LLQDVTKRLKEREIVVTWDQNIIDRIAVLGYDTLLGARPLKRAITEYIVNPLSEKILRGEILAGDNLLIRM